MKELSREYKAISKILFPPEKSKNGYTTKEIKESRAKALETIKNYLDSDNIEQQFENISGDYYSNEKFIVSWLCNHNGFPHEVTIDKVDLSYSGAKCILARRSLFSEAQLKSYHSFERALVEQGLKLCATKEIKTEFFNKYAVAYNDRLKQGKL